MIIEEILKRLENNTVITHGDVFHADDVYATALLKMLNKNIKVLRLNEVTKEQLEASIVYDIGGKDFDHHQQGSPIRENGIPYASFGLLWKAIGYHLVNNDEVVEEFDKQFVQKIDYTDNTGEPCELADIINDFVPTWNDTDQDMDNAFNKAVDFAYSILTRRIKCISDNNKAKEELSKTISSRKNSSILVLDKSLPWVEEVIKFNQTVSNEHKIKFCVYKSGRGEWNAQVVPRALDTKVPIIPFPDNWLSLRNKELQEVSGIATATFCHKQRFLFCATDKNDAIKACINVMEHYTESNELNLFQL